MLTRRLRVKFHVLILSVSAVFALPGDVRPLESPGIEYPTDPVARATVEALVEACTPAGSPSLNAIVEPGPIGFDPANSPPHVAPAAMPPCVPQEPGVEAIWDGDPRWMRGNPISGGETFFGSLGKATLWTIGSSVAPDDFVPVEIHFDGDSTYCQVFRVEQNFNSVGVGVFPGTVWDVSDDMNPRRLNVCFAEWNDGGGPNPPPNLRWDPDTTTGAPGFGKWEFLYVMASNYDGTGLTYAGRNILNEDLDVYYGWYPRVEPGHTLLESIPATLTINIFDDFIQFPNARPDSGLIELTWVYCGDGSPTEYRIYRNTTNPPTTQIGSVDGSTFVFVDDGLTNGVTYYYRIDILGPGDVVLGFSGVFAGTPQTISSNCEFVGNWNGRADYGDIWGYVDSVSGKEYALICARGEGASIVDLDLMEEVGFLPILGGGGDAKDIKVYKNYAILLMEYGPLQVHNIANPASPQFVSYIFTYDNRAHNCLVEGNYLYVCGQTSGGMEIFNLSVLPATPALAGQWFSYYYHDMDIRNDTLYAAAIYGDGIDIVNVANKAAPQLIANFDYPGSGAHNCELSADGRYLFVGDEIGTGPWTRVFDVSNPLAASKVFDINLGVPGSIVHNCYVKDGALYIGHYGLGLRIWNVLNPEAPFEIGFYDTNPASNVGMAGAWSVYPYLPSGRVIVSDMLTGLYVVTFTGSIEPGCVCDCHGDPQCDGITNVFDVVDVVDEAFRNGPSVTDVACPHLSRNDANCDCVVNVFDVVSFVDHAFRNNTDPFCDPCSDPCAGQ